MAGYRGRPEPERGWRWRVALYLLSAVPAAGNRMHLGPTNLAPPDSHARASHRSQSQSPAWLGQSSAGPQPAHVTGPPSDDGPPKLPPSSPYLASTHPIHDAPKSSIFHQPHRRRPSAGFIRRFPAVSITYCLSSEHNLGVAHNEGCSSRRVGAPGLRPGRRPQDEAQQGSSVRAAGASPLPLYCWALRGGLQTVVPSDVLMRLCFHRPATPSRPRSRLSARSTWALLVPSLAPMSSSTPSLPSLMASTPFPCPTS